MGTVTIIEAVSDAIQQKAAFNMAEYALKNRLLTELGELFPKVGWTEIPTLEIDTRTRSITFSYVVVWEEGGLDQPTETDRRLREFFHDNYPDMNVLIADRYTAPYRDSVTVAQTIRIYQEQIS